jgi:hypothetical protein
MDVSFLTSNRFWAMAIGVLVWYGKQKGYIGELEMQAITAFLTGFVGIKTVDRLGEKAGTTTIMATPVDSGYQSGK